MKTILTRHYIVEYVVTESDEEEQEIKRIIKEVEEEQGQTDLSEYQLVLPQNKDNVINGATK